MARTAWPTVNNGDSWSAAQHNTYGRDNDLAYWPGTTAGDIDYYISASAKTRLGIGTAGQRLAVNAGATAPEWVNGGIALIEEFVSVGGEADYTFATIPQTYSHLKLIMMGRSEKAETSSAVYAQFNADVGANYGEQYTQVINNVFTQLYFGGRTVIFWGVIPGATAVANYPGVSEMTIPNYTNTAFYKTTQSLNSLIRTADIGGCLTYIQHNVWLDTDAITDIKVKMTDGTYTFAAGTIISLYGLI